MRAIRDSWVSKVGWLVGRTVVQRMDEIWNGYSSINICFWKSQAQIFSRLGLPS
jgi:hypothetical protein